ncbi:hypothetical protein K469DRAFT_440606, partial [Zopfia rhizophila CBS 207.26]
LYMGVHVEPRLSMYWNINPDTEPIHPSVRKAMGRTRWQQIHRYFHIWNRFLPGALGHVRAHEKADPLANLLRETFKTYWNPGIYVTVDECIEGFTGRTSDIVNIPTKLNPIGFKIWVLAQIGYV